MYDMEQPRYTRIQVSRILDISIDTLRYFEKEGIVKPYINKTNNYRYYNAWDINYLIEYKYYRALRFSMTDTINILRSDDLAAFTRRMDKQQEYYHERRLFYTYLEECNRKKNESIMKIPEHLNKIYTQQIEATDYILHRDNDEYWTVSEQDGLLSKWWEYFSFLNRLLYIPASKFENNVNCYESGFSVETKWAEMLGVPRNSGTGHIPACKAVCTVVRSGGKGSFNLKLFDPILKYLEQNQISFSGKIYGNLLARVNEPDGYARFIEIFIPIQ